MNYDALYGKYLSLFESYMTSRLGGVDGHPTLVEAMKYSLFAGGKRIRPVLMLAATETFGARPEKALPLSLSVELIHTYSLIHDDLPAMDDDDLRRGKPTNHKVYGEAMAILAGDALLNFAFENALDSASDMTDVRAALYLARAAGYSGMIGGQAHDLSPIIANERERLEVTDELKTAKLITAPLVMSAIITGGDEAAMEAFGKRLGYIYQLVDDYLDVYGDEASLGKAVHKDASRGKRGGVEVLGKDGVKETIDRLQSECDEILSRVAHSDFLREFLHRSVVRTK